MKKLFNHLRSNCSPIFIALLLITTFISCSTIKKRTNLKKTQVQIKETESTSFELIKQKKQFYLDSSAARYELMVWPKGAVYFNPTSGFYGEADSFVFVGDAKKLIVSKEKSYQKQQGDFVKTRQQSLKTGEKEIEKVRKINYWWVLGVLGLLGFLLVLKFWRW